MAITNWTGTAGDTDWDNDGNWSGSAPSTGDTVTFLASATTGPLLNVDKSSGNLNLDMVHVEKGVTYAMGATATPLTFTCNLLHHHGYATLYFKSKGNPLTDAIVVVSSHPNALVLSASASAVTRLAVFGGGVSISAGMPSVSISSMLVSPTKNILLPKVSVVAAGTQLFGTIYFAGGNIIDGRGYANLWQCGGTFNSDSATHTNTRVFGGTFNANSTTSYGNFVHLGGTVDMLNANGGQVKAITSYRPNRLGVELIYDPSVHTVTDVIGV